MHSAREMFGYAIGLLAAASFAAAGSAATDPPAKAKQQGHSTATPHSGQSGRWHDNQGPAAHAAPHGSGAGHGADHGADHGPEIGFRGCAYFDGTGFAGRRGEIRDGATIEWLGRAWNDRISSTACHPGCRLVGYVDVNFVGARRNLSGAVADLGAGWNDRISALRAVCDGAAHAEAH